MLIYIILLIFIIFLLLILIASAIRTLQNVTLRHASVWYILLLILNFSNMAFTLYYYRKKNKEVGKKGDTGYRGPRGYRGSSFLCSQCGLSGKKMKPVYTTNRNDFGEIKNDPDIKIGKCVFPFIHNDEYQYKCVKESRKGNEENDSPKNGWCATSVNSELNYKTYGYCSPSDDIANRLKAEEEKRRKRREYMLSNTGLLDIRLVTGNRSSVQCPTGYTKINKDLNEDSGGKYIYLCKKMGLSSGGVVAISTVGDGENCPNNGRKLPYNLNKDSGGKKIYLCKQKTNKNFITDIKVQNTANCPENYSLNTENLNEGSGGKPVYICTSNERPSLIAIDTGFTYGKDKKTYFFKGDQYWKFDDSKENIAKDFPKNIVSKWGELPSDLDAVFTWGKNNKTYFFKGAKFWEFDDKRLKIASGYPKLIKDFWKGVPDNIDSVFTWGKDGKTYFFKGKFYYRFNDKMQKVDRGYPKEIKKRWKNAPISFNSIFTYGYDNKTYIFRADQYWVIGKDDEVSGDYPKKINTRFRGLY